MSRQFIILSHTKFFAESVTIECVIVFKAVRNVGRRKGLKFNGTCSPEEVRFLPAITLANIHATIIAQQYPFTVISFLMTWTEFAPTPLLLADIAESSGAYPGLTAQFIRYTLDFRHPARTNQIRTINLLTQSSGNSIPFLVAHHKFICIVEILPYCFCVRLSDCELLYCGCGKSPASNSDPLCMLVVTKGES